MRILYTFCLYLLMPFIVLRMLWRSRNNAMHRQRWHERFGFVTKTHSRKKIIWLHTVSVGEFLGALPLIKELLKQDDIQLVITSTTLTGSERVQHILGDKVYHCYIPYDLPFALSLFIQRVRPQMLLIMETELWPNTLHMCSKFKIPSILINARLSERSARGYTKIATLTRTMLTQLTHVAAQHTDDAERFIKLGLAPEKITVTGSIKFDIELPGALRTQACELKHHWSLAGNRIIWVAASTHSGEDEIILHALQQLRKAGFNAEALLLLLVPRHPERFDRVESLIKNCDFRVLRRTKKIHPDKKTDVVLIDTMGELPLLFGLSDIAFMGGSLSETGGHNFIEPAAWGLPLISGPHLHNFSEISQLLINAQALDIVKNEGDLSATVQLLIRSPNERKAKGQAALNVANNNRGALAQTLALITSYSTNLTRKP